ncbi:hypothetical protein LTR39_004721, partial [Cryomyces antarcticus]
HRPQQRHDLHLRCRLRHQRHRQPHPPPILYHLPRLRPDQHDQPRPPRRDAPPPVPHLRRREARRALGHRRRQRGVRARAGLRRRRRRPPAAGKPFSTRWRAPRRACEFPGPGRPWTAGARAGRCM